MTVRIRRERLLEILGNDEEIVVRLVEEGLIIDSSEGFDPRDVERALVARTLLRDLDVNWPGVEVVLSMRDQLRATQQQIAQTIAALRKAAKERELADRDRGSDRG